MIHAAKNSVRKTTLKPALLSVFKKAEKEYRQTQEMFDLLGWGELPAELKFTIEDDVKGYVDELHGRYSTHCPLVQRRRESVDFWVKSYMDEICSLETAVDALKVSRI
jgi:hypothetical protein